MDPKTIKRKPNEINYKEKYLEILVKEKLPYSGQAPHLYKGFLLPYYTHCQENLIDSMTKIMQEGYTAVEITIAAIRVFDLKDTYKEESNE